MSAAALENPMPTPLLQKVVIESAGSYDKLTLRSEPAPEPGRGEVRIAVMATGVNYADVVVRMGLYSSAKEYVGWPITPGFEVAGVIDAVGEGVDDLAIGDEVIGVTLFGGYTSHIVLGRPYVARKPAGIDFAEAAAVPAVFMTAYYALFELAHPRPGQVVLVHSAAGGVGGSLVQLLKIIGCEVVGVVGASHKVEAAKKFGADHVIDKSTQDLWAEAERYAPDGYDLVLDANGVSTLKDSYTHLRKAGKLVVYGFASMMSKDKGRPNWARIAVAWMRTPRFSPFEMVQNSHSVLAFNLSYLFDRVDLLHECLAAIEGWLESGEIVPPPVSKYALKDVAQAHRDIESGQTIGKLVLIPDHTS